MYFFAVSIDNVGFYSIDGQNHGILHLGSLFFFLQIGLIETTGHFIYFVLQSRQEVFLRRLVKLAIEQPTNVVALISSGQS